MATEKIVSILCDEISVENFNALIQELMKKYVCNSLYISYIIIIYNKSMIICNYNDY